MAIEGLSTNNLSMVRSMATSTANVATMTERSAGLSVPLTGSEGLAKQVSAAEVTAVKPQANNSEAIEDDSLQQLNESLQKVGSNILFESDEDSGKMLFLMKDAETGETIRQIPNEVVLKISRAIGEYLDTAQLDSKKENHANSALAKSLSGFITNMTV